MCTFDDLAKDFYRLIVKANSMRDDLVIYLFGHVQLQTDIYGDEQLTLLTNGRKLEKIKLETKVPIVLVSHSEHGSNGDNNYSFETQKNRSIGKTPIGMFKDFRIPNSLNLVDTTIREYYGI